MAAMRPAWSQDGAVSGDTCEGAKTVCAWGCGPRMLGAGGRHYDVPWSAAHGLMQNHGPEDATPCGVGTLKEEELPLV